MLRIVSKADTAESFIQIFAHLCDRESLFIVTRSPKAIGTLTRFSINLKTGEPVIRGQGKVIERFEDKENRYGRVGMRLGFTELDGTSRDFIDRLVAARQAQQATQATAAEILGNAATEPANTETARTAETSGTIEVASPEKPADAPPRSEERARGSDFILPANPFGELTDNVLEAFIECSLYEEIASNSDPAITSKSEPDIKPPGDSIGDHGRQSEPWAEPWAEKSAEPPPVPGTRSSTDPGDAPPFSVNRPPATPPFSVTSPAPSAPGPMPMSAVAVATPPGLPAQSMSIPVPAPGPGGGPTPAPPMPAPAAMPAPPTLQRGGYPVAENYRRPSDANWKAIAVAVVLATLVSLGVGYMLWGGSKDTAPEQPDSKQDTQEAAGTAGDTDEPGADSQDKGEQAAPNDGSDSDGDGDSDGEGDEAGAENPAGLAGATEKDDGDSDSAADIAAAGAAAADTGECQARIESDPSKAVVYLGERELGATPLNITLPCGEVELRFTRARRDDKLMTVTLAAGEANEIEADLERPTVELVVKSAPGGAEVFLNGKKRGTTPTTLQVPGYRSGTLEIKKPGYRTHKKRVYPKGPRSTVDATLRKLRRR